MRGWRQRQGSEDSTAREIYGWGPEGFLKLGKIMQLVLMRRALEIGRG